MGETEVARAERGVRQATFLAHYRRVGTITKACELAGIGSRQTVYDWQAGNGGDTFTTQMQEARVQATELLEEEARRRAVDGWLEPVYQKGEEVGQIRKFSDALLLSLLQANAPERFRARVDVRAVQDREIEDTLTPAQREAFRAVMVAQLGAAASTAATSTDTDGGDIEADYRTLPEAE